MKRRHVSKPIFLKKTSGYGALWAWAMTLMGPMGPGQDPYGALSA